MVWQTAAVDNDRKPKLTVPKRNKLPTVDGGRKPKFTLPKRGKLPAVDGGRKPKFTLPKRNTLPVRNRRKLRPRATACFLCGKDEGGESVHCSRRRCAKIYHLACLELHEQPQGNELHSALVNCSVTVLLLYHWLLSEAAENFLARDAFVRTIVTLLP